MSARDDYPLMAATLQGVSIPFTPPECVSPGQLEVHRAFTEIDMLRARCSELRDHADVLAGVVRQFRATAISVDRLVHGDAADALGGYIAATSAAVPSGGV